MARCRRRSGGVEIKEVNGGGSMRHLSLVLSVAAVLVPVIAAPATLAQQSTLLESVKRNPDEARAMCRQFKTLNAKNISATSAQSINAVANQRNLSRQDAEILVTYVIGLHCPDVR
jgi:hypothetical protein